MKLSKEDLRFALWYTSRSTSDIFGQAADRLDNGGTLEIEGYVREDHFADDSKMGWNKFDPNDPKTFPPELTRVQVFDKESGDVLTAKFDLDSREWSLSWCMITHWRPLPEPPQETEEKNDQGF